MAACRHDQMSIQEYNKKINGLKSSYDIVYFSLNCLVQIEHKVWDYCFCSDHTNDRLWKEEIPKNMLITKNNFFISLIYSSLIFVWFVCFLSFSQLKKGKKMVNYESSIPRFEKFWTQFEQVWVLWLFLF